MSDVSFDATEAPVAQATESETVSTPTPPAAKAKKAVPVKKAKTEKVPIAGTPPTPFKAEKKAPPPPVGVKVPKHGGGPVKGAPKANPKALAKTPPPGGGVKQYVQIADMLKSAGDATRLAVLHILATAAHNVGQICVQVGSTQPAVSHHLALMRHQGLIVPTREGKHVSYALTEKGEAMHAAVRAIAG